MIDLSKEKLELNYPCNWIYKVIGSTELEIQKAVIEIVEGREYTLIHSHISKKGKFLSFTLEMLVHNEDDRKMLYEMLCAHKDIKMVL